MINRKALFSDETSLFKTPYEPVAGDRVTLKFRTLKNDVSKVYAVINGVQSGSIILMHNNGLHTAEAVPIILETLKNRGYSFVPIGELIYRENYVVDGTGRQKSVQKETL